MRLAERPLALVGAAVVLQWLTTLVVALEAGWSREPLQVVNVFLLGPAAVVAVYKLAASVGGVALGAWSLLVWVSAPWLARPLTLASYDSTVRDDVLPLALGLTPDRGYAEGVAILVAVALLTDRTRLIRAAGALVLGALVVVWLTHLPVPDLSRAAFDGAMAGLREYFWSQRLLQWLPIAGAIGVARRSVPLALTLAGWLGAYLVLRWAHPGGGFENGEIFRELLPALPAYVVLVSALPLLVPTLAARLGALARPASVS